jgi:hypothetical protein
MQKKKGKKKVTNTKQLTAGITEKWKATVVQSEQGLAVDTTKADSSAGAMQHLSGGCGWRSLSATQQRDQRSPKSYSIL